MGSAKLLHRGCHHHANVGNGERPWDDVMLPQRREVWEHFRTRQRVQILGTGEDITRPQTYTVVMFLQMDKPQEGVKVMKLQHFMGNVSKTGIHTWRRIQDIYGKQIDPTEPGEEEAHEITEGNRW